MKVSVVIPTYNGANKIPNVLRALEKQTIQDFETIVVIDGSTDNTVEVLRALNLTLKSFRIIEQENKGRAAVRNKGGQEAKGDLLIFFDDDMRPEPDCISQHVLHHENINKSTIAVGRSAEDVKLCITDFHFYRAYLSDKWAHIIIKENQ